MSIKNPYRRPAGAGGYAAALIILLLLAGVVALVLKLMGKMV